MEEYEGNKVSWAREALTAIRQIILIEHRMDTLTERVKPIAVTCHDLVAVLGRTEAKFELLERMATPSRRSVPDKSEK
jgi:hypothetical protein